MYHPTDRITLTTAFVTPVVKHWQEREMYLFGVMSRHPRFRLRNYLHPNKGSDDMISDLTSNKLQDSKMNIATRVGIDPDTPPPLPNMVQLNDTLSRCVILVCVYTQGRVVLCNIIT